jgi:hypothetical protein
MWEPESRISRAAISEYHPLMLVDLAQAMYNLFIIAEKDFLMLKSSEIAISSFRRII